MEIFDFSSYKLIIDARTPREFSEDHIPGAINLPVAYDDEYAEVGTLHRTNPFLSYQCGAQYALKNIAHHLRDTVAKYDRKDRILVYCFRGGKRSRGWFEVLNMIGYRVERFEGGWKRYRRWVNDQLQCMPSQFRYIVINGPTGSGKTRLLSALAEAGAQVLDLEGLACHRGSVIGAIPGRAQPSQKMFDSLLLAKLSTFDINTPIWVEAESKKIGSVAVPEGMLTTMRAGTILSLNVSISQRVQMLLEDYQHFQVDPQSLIAKLQGLKIHVGAAEMKEWHTLANQGAIPELSERLLRVHYDPAYRRSSLRNYPNIESTPVVKINDLSAQALLPLARRLRNQYETSPFWR